MVATVERSTDVYQCLRPVPELTGEWWVCYTHGGMEKRLAKRLQAERVDYFLPLSEYRDSQRHIKSRPLYANYLFLNGYDSREVASRAIEKIVIWPVSTKTQTILQHELEQIYRALQVNPALGTELAPLKRGQAVKVLAGPFMGCEGVYDAESHKQRVWLLLSIMGGRAVPIEVPREYVEILAN